MSHFPLAKINGQAHVPATLKIVEAAGHGFGGRDADEQVKAFLRTT